MAETTSNKYDYKNLNSLAVVSLASAATGFGAVAAVITGHIALAQLKESNQKGRWMAITGLVLGYASIAFTLLFWTYAAARFGAHDGMGGFDGGFNGGFNGHHGIDDGFNGQVKDYNRCLTMNDGFGGQNCGPIPPVQSGMPTPMPTPMPTAVPGTTN
jgi:hypothetical protein